MNNHTIGLSELIQSLKRDGILAGENERNRIVEQAKKESEKIINNAAEKANTLISKAENKCLAKTSQMESELKMAARDFLLKFKSELREKIIYPEIKNKISDAINGDDFIKDCLKNLILEYTKSDKKKFEAIVSKPIKEKLINFFKTKLSKSVIEDSMPTIIVGDNLSGFKLKLNGENFVWDFSLDAISYELSKFIDPSLTSFLIGKKKINKNI